MMNAEEYRSYLEAKSLERKRFERWAKAKSLDVSREREFHADPSPQYTDETTWNEWQGWKAIFLGPAEDFQSKEAEK